MQLEIVYSNSMKINKGNYEQEAPFYSLKSIIEVRDPKEVESVCNSEYARLQAIVEPLLEADYNKNRTDLANIRIREKNGKKYPSVTSILNPDGMSNKIKNLEQYTQRGNEVDRVFKALMLGTKYKAIDYSLFADLPEEKWEEKIKAFIIENKILKKLERPLWKKDVEVFNDEWMYSGEIDLLKENYLILDVKSGAWKWEQQIAYAKCIPSITHVAIADLKNNKYLELSINDPCIIRAWENFIYKRGQFFSRFNL